ncbi:hypothetical protein [Spirosoma validum]|uniref:Wadjet protein JetD C-terminal domain-containing protein n=1 Tax=Spirosoma validum TaxID=2771355 RepID=A0A927GEV2_9BACT|nr:hypothetical protein [Spirosoma validum]MBD2755184.1 hypothetical protein [Spirosoma validum]
MNWLTATKLHQLYTNKSTVSTDQFVSDATIQGFINTTGELCIDGRNVIVNNSREESFLEYYELKYLPKYQRYNALLDKHKLLTDKNGRKKVQVRYEEDELAVLLKLDEQMSDGSVAEIRKQIIEREESIRGVSRMFFFNDEKYLDEKKSLVEALKRVLDIDKLANDKGEQWIYKLTIPNRKLVVLCENLDFLRRPTRPRKYQIELWYAGGRNTPKLEYERTLLDVPIYYSCDWDHDGLEIYQDVKGRLPTIQLLTPISNAINLADSPNHHSYWEELDSTWIDNISEENLSNNHKNIINNLIAKEAWIREEDNDLIEMLISNDAIANL